MIHTSVMKSTKQDAHSPASNTARDATQDFSHRFQVTFASELQMLSFKVTHTSSKIKSDSEAGCHGAQTDPGPPKACVCFQIQVQDIVHFHQHIPKRALKRCMAC